MGAPATGAGDPAAAAAMTFQSLPAGSSTIRTLPFSGRLAPSYVL
jgi:hypothetical protein